MTSSRERIKTIEAAEKYIKNGKLREAIEEYRNLLAKDPQDINIINIIGDLYVRLDEKSKAQEEFQKIASYYEEKGLYPQSIAIYKKIIKLNPEDVAAATKLAGLYRNYGFLSEAKKEYLRIADALKKSGRQAEAIPVYEKLTKLDKDDLEARLALAELYHKQGMVEEASGELNTVAEVKLREERLKEAEELLLKANDLKESQVRTVTNLVQLFRKGDRMKEAQALLASVLKKDAENVKFLQLLGTVYFENKNFSKAKETFSRIQKLKGLDPETRIKLGRIYIHEGELDGAFELYEPVVDALLARQRVEKAVGLLGLILSSREVHLPSLEKLASIYESTLQPEKLETIYRVILEEYREKKFKEESLSVLEKLVKICPQDKELVQEYRSLRKELGHPEEGIEVKTSEFPEEDRETIKMKLAKVELYLEQGSIRDAKRILEELKADYSDESKIDQKIAFLDEIRTRVEAGEIVGRTEAAGIPEVEEEPERLEPRREEKISVAEIFSETDIITEVAPHTSEWKYYDLAETLEGELGIIRSIVQHQLKGDTQTFEQELSAIVSKFKKEMDEKLDRDDYDIHYNLGIAFLEQGLTEEALDEFKIACQDEKRALDCYSIISYCYKQKKEFKEGVKWIEKGLQLTEEGTDQRLSLKYDLGSLYEEMKQNDRALKLYEEIQKVSPDYRAVEERIKKLKKLSSK